MRSPVRIRAARADDAPVLAAAWEEFGRYYAEIDPARFTVPSPEGLTDWVASCLDEAGEDEAWLLAEDDEDFLGYVKASIRRPNANAGRAVMRDATRIMLTIDALIVREPVRRRGIGTALLRAAESWGRANGASALFLSTSADSSSALLFYEAVGYERVSIGFSTSL